MLKSAPTQAAPSGKQVGESLYLHRDAVAALSPAARSLIWEAEALTGASQWNVVKLRGASAERISLLTYEDFERPFPALLESFTVDLENKTAARRSYRARPNPPVLHRKELLLPADHPRREEYAGLTQALEKRGLLRETSSIGTRQAWEQRLREAGVRVVGHSLEEDGGGSPQSSITIRRHLAAIRRDWFSSPIQALIRHGLINEAATVFDYGCGFGSDVEALVTSGITASGWDPFYAPDVPLQRADVVNLGFVLNVIEDPAERSDVLRSAFAIARRCLSVAVITSSRARPDSCRPYGDGYVTRLGTFQKFYQPPELKELVEKVLGREAFAAGPGLLFVFADPLAEQSFLVSRQSRRPFSRMVTSAPRKAKEAVFENLRPDLDAIVATAEELGRWPATDELAADLFDRLTAAKMPIAKALRLAGSLSDPQVLEDAAKQRKDDIAVYLALNEFNRRRNYRALPERLQRDVRALFGSYATAQAAGRELLYSLANPDGLARAAAEACDFKLGHLDEEESFWICAELIPRLPAALRCFAGCAERYSGGLDEAHLVKIHLRTGKLTLLRYADFDLSPMPRLELRTKIDLRRQRISDFDHVEEDQRLLLKSRFMAPDQVGFERQERFDTQAVSIGLDTLGTRATGLEIAAAIKTAGYTVSGWKWSLNVPAE